MTLSVVLATAISVSLLQSANPQTPAAASAPASQSQHPNPNAAGAQSPNSSAATDVLQMQVMLDRAGFSPGAIDGRMGAVTRRALALYQQQHGSENAPDVPPLTTYTITPEDAAGPFVEHIPSDLVQQATLPALSYTSVVEAVAERFHTTPVVLRRLNPQASFAAGEPVQVPNVDPLVAPVAKSEVAPEARGAARQDRSSQPAGTSGRRGGAAAPSEPNALLQRPDVVVTVGKSGSSLTVTDASGRVALFAPVTTGSQHDPLPIGEWKVTGIQFNPTFNYNPDLFWDAEPSHSKAKIPAGPNNPVGLVWIDLSKPHYGIHGTPEPSTIGRTESHGCVRLTNWDALKLAALVKPGTKVIFTD